MSSDETIKLNVSLGIGISNAEQTATLNTGITRTDWESMSSDEQEKTASEAINDWIWEHIDTGWQVADS
ncbi:hypothetical protein ABT352_33020 [Streptosporangium sp. NPDC000563]|uniref:DUF7167 family protein n=1 Tax=Streptosporangium sp. NPDC000563 TaxID=3154366 RepID=UPI003319CACC